MNCFIQHNKAHMTLEVETMGNIQIVVFCIILMGTLYAPTMSHVFIPQEIKIKMIKLLQNILFRSSSYIYLHCYHCLLWSLTTELGKLSFVLSLWSPCHKLMALKNCSSLPDSLHASAGTHCREQHYYHCIPCHGWCFYSVLYFRTVFMHILSVFQVSFECAWSPLDVVEKVTYIEDCPSTNLSDPCH